MNDIKSLARANTGVEDALLFDLDHNPFLPKDGWGAVTMFMMDWDHRETPLTTGTPGSHSIFMLHRNHDQTGPIFMRFSVPPITSSGSPDFLRLVDFAGIRIIEQVDLNYGNHNFCTLTHEYIKERYDELLKREAKGFDSMVGGNLSNAQREILATKQQNFEVDIHVPWQEDLGYWYPQCAMGQELEIRVKWANPRSVIQCSIPDATVNYSIINQEMSMIQVHHNNKDKADTIAATKRPNGIVYKLIEHSRHSRTYELTEITAAMAAQKPLEFDLTPFRGATNALEVYIQLVNQTESTVLGNDPYNPQRIDSLSLNLNNTFVWPVQTHDQLVHKWFPKFHKGETGRNLYLLSHALDPKNRIHNTNSLNYGYTGRKILRLGWDSGSRYVPTSSIRVTVVAYENNFFQIHDSDIQRLLK